MERHDVGHEATRTRRDEDAAGARQPNSGESPPPRAPAALGKIASPSTPPQHSPSTSEPASESGSAAQGPSPCPPPPTRSAAATELLANAAIERILRASPSDHRKVLNLTTASPSAAEVNKAFASQRLLVDPDAIEAHARLRAAHEALLDGLAQQPAAPSLSANGDDGASSSPPDGAADEGVACLEELYKSSFWGMARPRPRTTMMRMPPPPSQTSSQKFR